MSSNNDKQFLDRLEFVGRKERQDVALGLGGNLQAIAAKIAGVVTDLVNAPVVLGVRNLLTPQIAIFLGDVFVYLQQAERRDQIRNTILTSILEAARNATERKENLILCGHSMGGLILYHILSNQSTVDALSESLKRPFKTDLLLTVGSQVGLFEELKLFTTSHNGDSAASGKKANGPIGVARWWNVYNRLDV